MTTVEDSISVIITPCPRGKVEIRIRGVGHRYDSVWDMINQLPEDHVFDPWDNMPWSGFSTQHEIVILEIGKIVGTENISVEHREYLC